MASFDDLAEGLIKARIAGGLSQRALAQRLELKEQQIQRYEAERYASASYKRLCQVAHALGVRIENEILLPMVPGSFEGLVAKVSQVGLSREFVVGRLLSTADAAIAEGGGARRIERPETDREGRGRAGARFWLGARQHLRRTGTVGGMDGDRGGALQDAEGSSGERPRGCSRRTRTIWPSSPYGGWPTIRRRRSRPNRPRCGTGFWREARGWTIYAPCCTRCGISAWSCCRSGARGRSTAPAGATRAATPSFSSRRRSTKRAGTFDLLHELFHAAQRPGEKTFELVEADATSSERRESDEEIAASQYAGDVHAGRHGGGAGAALRGAGPKQRPAPEARGPAGGDDGRGERRRAGQLPGVQAVLAGA